MEWILFHENNLARYNNQNDIYLFLDSEEILTNKL